MNMSTKIVPRLARFQSRQCTRNLTYIQPHSQYCIQSRTPIVNTFNSQRRNYASTPAEETSSPMPAQRKKKIIVAMTGATGAVLGIKILKALRRLNVETHLIMSKWADATLKYETDYTAMDIRALANFSYSIREQSAAISSGSFQHDGMVVVPCSMKTLAGIRMGYCEDLITRAADVVIKENRKLVLVVRETPLSPIHLENMLGLSRMGVTIFPPVPAWYTRPKSLEDVEDQSVGRILDMFHLDTGDFERWNGFENKKKAGKSASGSEDS